MSVLGEFLEILLGILMKHVEKQIKVMRRHSWNSIDFSELAEKNREPSQSKSQVRFENDVELITGNITLEKHFA
jgi:hypothetical protein